MLKFTTINIGGLTDAKTEYVKAHILNNQDIIAIQEIKSGKIYHPTHHFKRTQSEHLFSKQGLCLGFESSKFKIIDEEVVDPDRIVIHTLNTNNNIPIKIMNIYNSNNHSENKTNLKRIIKYINQFKDHNWIISGDMNTSLKQHTKNDNHTKLLINIREAINGKIYPQEDETPEQMFTIERYGKRVIDYIITNMQVSNHYIDHSCHISDHYPLSIEINIQAPTKILNWKKFKGKHKKIIEKKCGIIQSEMNTISQDSCWTKKSYKLISENLMDNRREIKQYRSKHLDMIDKMNNLRRDIRKENNIIKKEEMKREVKELIKIIESELLENRILNIQNIINKANKTMRRITYVKERRQDIKKIKHDTIITFNEEEIVKHMNKHFKTVIAPKDPNILVNQKKQLTEIQDCHLRLFSKLSMEETLELFQKFKDSTPGEDGVRGVTIKWTTDETKHILVEWINRCITEGVNVEAKIATIIPIPKINDPQEPSDYRGIVLLSTLYKMITSIIQKRLYNMIHNRISKSQFGARKERSTIDANFLFQNLKSISKLTNQELHILGVDIKKAFDSVPMRLVRDSLHFFGIDLKSIDMIIDLIDQTPMKTKVNDTYSDSFIQTSGIKQGDALSPLLFVLALDFILQLLEDLPGFDHRLKYSKIGFTINNMAYMDDTDLIGSTQERLIVLWNRFNELLQSYGMELNEKKTEYWTNSLNTSITVSNHTISKKPWVRKLGDFEDDQGKQRRTKALERVKEKLDRIKPWYFTIEQAIKIINTDIVPIADFILQQDRNIESTEAINKMIKNYLSTTFKLNRSMITKKWHLKQEHFGLGLTDLKLYHTKTFLNNIRRHQNIMDIHIFINSTQFVREIFIEKFGKNPMTYPSLSRKEKNFLPNHIVKMAEINQLMKLEVIEKTTDWKMICVSELQEVLHEPTNFILECKKQGFNVLGDLFKRRKRHIIWQGIIKGIELEPKEKIISKVWSGFSTVGTRLWRKIAKRAELLINKPKIRLKKALLRQPTIDIKQLEGSEEITIATDGSFEKKKGGIGIVTNNQQIAMNAFAAASSFDCEIQAIYMAVRMTTNFQRINIISDSQASIKIIQSDRKTANPYVNTEDVETVKLNGKADKAANIGRNITKKSLAIPPLEELDEYLITMDNRIVYDRIDRLLYDSIYEEEVTEAKKYANHNMRQNRITPKQGIVTRNQINVAIRAATNSLPILNKWVKGQGCPLPKCTEDETIPHAIFECKEMEAIRRPLREKLLTNLQSITNQPLDSIKRQFEELTTKIHQTYSPIYMGILPKALYKSWNGKEKSKEIQIEFIKFTHQIWIERCNQIHQIK